MKKAKIYVVFYSTYYHNFKTAKVIKEAIDSTGHAECTIFRVPETLPKEVLEKMHAPPAPDVPVITASQLTEADGIIIGTPTRFGSPAAQMKAFLDSTGAQWSSGALAGKLGGCFTSSGTQNGGTVSTVQAIISWFVHQGMLFVPQGYLDKKQFDVEKVHGISPWSVGTIAGPTGQLELTETDISAAKTYGTTFAKYTAKMINSTI